MNRKILFIFVVFLLISAHLWSQGSCGKKLDIVKNRLENQKNLTNRFLDELNTFADTCMADNGISHYIKGLMALRRKPNDLSLSLEHFRKAADHGYTRAKTYLGYLYKNGRGIPADLSRSLYWIRQAAGEGDDNAIYTLGYYHLKGLAGLEPDYAKAVSCFERSDHRMAKYWLAFCQHFDLGTTGDEEYATGLLEQNRTPESEQLLDFIENDPYTGLEDFKARQGPVSSPIPANGPQRVYQGLWIEKDWKDQKVLRKIPLTITFVPSVASGTHIKITIQGRDCPASLDKYGRLAPPYPELRLSAPFSGPDSPGEMTYRIKDLKMYKDPKTGIRDMECTTWIDEYGEKGPPVTIRMFGREALDQKIEASFSVYPNAFRRFLNFSFSIEHQSEVSLAIYDLKGFRIQGGNHHTLQNGRHVLAFNGGNLPPRNYIAVLTVNGSRFVRQVVKID